MWLNRNRRRTGSQGPVFGRAMDGFGETNADLIAAIFDADGDSDADDAVVLVDGDALTAPISHWEDVEFRVGIAEGLDPQQPASPLADPENAGAGSIAMTSNASWWNGLVCVTCGQTFRRGDLVRKAPGLSTPQHADLAMHCAPRAVADAMEDAGRDDAAAFASALLESWPPLPGVQVIELAADDWHVGRPDRQSRPVVCLYCAHTFRAGEHVVLCPCRHSGLLEPGIEGCGAAVHRFPAGGMSCWEKWCPSSQIEVCPVRLSRRGDPT